MRGTVCQVPFKRAASYIFSRKRDIHSLILPPCVNETISYISGLFPQEHKFEYFLALQILDPEHA